MMFRQRATTKKWLTRLGVCTQTSLLRLGSALLHPAVSLLDWPHKNRAAFTTETLNSKQGQCPQPHIHKLTNTDEGVPRRQ